MEAAMITVISGLPSGVAAFLQKNPVIATWVYQLLTELGENAWRNFIAAAKVLVDEDEEILVPDFLRILSASKVQGFTRKQHYYFLEERAKEDSPLIFQAQRIMDFLNVFIALCEKDEDLKNKLSQLLRHCYVLARTVWDFRTKPREPE